MFQFSRLRTLCVLLIFWMFSFLTQAMDIYNYGRKDSESRTSKSLNDSYKSYADLFWNKELTEQGISSGHLENRLKRSIKSDYLNSVNTTKSEGRGFIKNLVGNLGGFLTKTITESHRNLFKNVPPKTRRPLLKTTHKPFSRPHEYNYGQNKHNLLAGIFSTPKPWGTSYTMKTTTTTTTSNPIMKPTDPEYVAPVMYIPPPPSTTERYVEPSLPPPPLAPSSVPSQEQSQVPSATQPPPPTTIAPSSGVIPSNPLESEALTAHNEYRAKHGAPPLTLTSELNQAAQAWANRLAGMGVMEHSTSDFGENIFWGSSPKLESGRIPVDDWYSEIKVFNWNCMECNLMDTGHFTQVVWKETREMGIARAVGPKGIYVVANYNPGANMQGEFQENVLHPKY